MEMCSRFGPSRRVPVLASIDGTPSFEVIATITDDILTDPPGQPGRSMSLRPNATTIIFAG
jgi:hypothetical protein